MSEFTSSLEASVIGILLIFVFAATVCSVEAADPNQKPLNQPPKGFVALFNGKDLTGWKGLVGSPVTRKKMSPEELSKEQAKADEGMRALW